MPDFDLELDAQDYVNSCSSREIQDLIDELIDCGHLPKTTQRDSNESRCFSEHEFQAALNKLQNKWNMLSEEETAFITNLAKRF